MVPLSGSFGKRVASKRRETKPPARLIRGTPVSYLILDTRMKESLT